MDAELVAWGERVRGCGDGQLMAELQQLVRRDRRGEVRLLMYLAEVDQRRLFLELGYSCLIRYATAVLCMSGQQAYLRIQAARLARRFPVIFEMLAEGAVSLSTLKQLDQHLTVDNHLALLERARNRTKDEVALLVAEVAPQDDVPTRMRKLPARAASKQPDLVAAANAAIVLCERVQPVAAPNAAVGAGVDPAQPSAAAASGSYTSGATAVQAAGVEVSAALFSEAGERVPAAFSLKAPRASCTPLRPGRFKLQLTASQALHDKLMQLQHLLRHQVPDGDFAAILERACDVLLEQTLKQRFAQVSKPRSSAVKSRVAAARVRSEHAGPAADRLDGRLSTAVKSNADVAIACSIACGDGRSVSAGEPLENEVPATDLQIAASPAAESTSKVVSARSGEQSTPASRELDHKVYADERLEANRVAADRRKQALGTDAADNSSTRRRARRRRYIPRAVIREVFVRDGEQCTFVGPDGHRCSERGMLEVHHVRAFAFGGEATVENLRLVCRGHNSFFAVQDFGAAHMLTKRASSSISSHQPLLFPDLAAPINN